MLKNIPACISPELIFTLMKMGHGDEIVLADADFPADSCNTHVIRADGIPLEIMLDAMIRFYPLDQFSPCPVAVMAPVKEMAPEPETWTGYRNILKKHSDVFTDLQPLERFGFYERAKRAFAIVITGELDGNIILKKGVVNLEAVH